MLDLLTSFKLFAEIETILLSSDLTEFEKSSTDFNGKPFDISVNWEIGLGFISFNCLESSFVFVAKSLIFHSP